jgi:hypothetical protein
MTLLSRRAIEVNRPYLRVVGAIFIIISLTNCAKPYIHRIAEPAAAWRTRTGQLMYRNTRTTLIGDVVVRFSKTGDFELTFSKGAGSPLLFLRQDLQYADVKGALARSGWSGAIERAPTQLRGWLELRDRILHGQNEKTIRYSAGGEIFWLRFQ